MVSLSLKVSISIVKLTPVISGNNEGKDGLHKSRKHEQRKKPSKLNEIKALPLFMIFDVMKFIL